MPLLLDRVFETGVRHGAADVEHLAQRIQGAFVLQGLQLNGVSGDAIAVWVAVDEDARIRGHLVAVDDTFGGHRIAFIQQLVMDPGVVPRAIQRQAQEECEAWSRSLGHEWQLMLTAHVPGRSWALIERVVRAWGRLFGFSLWRLCCRKVL